MTHPLVVQLRFTRSEFRRGLVNLCDEDARKRIQPMNCISWNVGHLTWQEQRYWLHFAQDRIILPWINDQFRFGAPASTPPLADVWQAWEEITAAADPWLDALTQATINVSLDRVGGPANVSVGSLLLRNIYHYWYHTGENAAIRQQLGHTELPAFVGPLDKLAPYRAEAAQ